MKKLMTIFVGLGLMGHQALASAVTESVTGETFAGYANSVIGTSGTFLTDLGNSTDGVNWSSNLSDITDRITDTSAGTNVLGTSAGAYLDLGFSAGVLNGAGDDLKLFFVGGNAHNFDVTIGGVTNSYTIGSGIAGATSSVDPAYPTDPLIALAIDFSNSEWAGLSGDPITQLRLTIGDGYTIDSAVPSFVGANAVVPVPAAVWLFGSGLLGLVGIAKRRRR